MLLDCDHEGELTREELNQFASMATNFQLLPSEKCAAPGSACADSLSLLTLHSGAGRGTLHRSGWEASQTKCSKRQTLTATG